MCSYLPLHFKRILLTILTCPPHILTFKNADRRGTLHYPEIKGTSPAEVKIATYRTELFFSNRLAYGSTYLHYKPRDWYFEFFCTMRKMILTGALVLFGAGTAVQVVTALMVCVLWIMLLSNVGPYANATDDRLAQVEGLQVLFTMLIGLVLQLEAQNAEVSEGASGAELGACLIVLNVAVVVCALIQQPFMLYLWKTLSMGPRRCALRKALEQEWANVAVVDATDEDYVNDVSLFDWCVTGGEQPHILAARPRLLVEVGAASEKLRAEAADIHGSWAAGEVLFFDSSGKRVSDPIHTTSDDGADIWADAQSKRLLEGAPLELMEAQSWSTATHWLDTHNGVLLSQQPA